MTAPAEVAFTRDGKLAAEVVPDQVLPKVLTTFGLIAIYVFIIYFITGSSIISSAGWTSMPMWVLGFVVFLVPAGMAVMELGNLWPAQGGVYVWAYRTMNEPLAFFGGFLSWIPVILNGATTPAAIVAFLALAFGAEIGLTTSILLQLLILWLAVGLALRKLTVTQKVMYTVFGVYAAICLAVFFVGIANAATDGSAVPLVAKDLYTVDFANYGWVFGLVLLYLLGVETPFNMGAEFLSVRRSAVKMVALGSIVLAVGYVITTAGILMSTPLEKIDPVTGVIGSLDTAGIPGLMPLAAVALAVVMVIALTTYQSAYARLIFVSGIERHLPRLFTHLNPRTRNPVTAVLVQGVISSTMIVVLYSQSSLATTFLYLQGALTIVWLASGYFFFVPLAIARWKYADRYASEDFWRIPGGKPAAVLTSVVGSLATTAGIYYTYTLPFSADIPQSDWMTWVGATIAITVAAAGLVYVFGRRSAGKLTQEDSLAHLAVLEIPEQKPAPTTTPSA
ncbi:APC family permease [Kineosporia sp. R_H_3]|uniref:APC family permease n=1 Tax=Kineosporia sp. R_H_3 TaxID=1961848 RepID=UPI0018E981E7|nr:APC family permease [Kineosporia sp. R_H_3]